MKLVQRLTLIVFILTAIVFGYSLYDMSAKADRTYPEISILDEEAVLKVSVNATEKDLLAGVSAYDKKDGDLTNLIAIESISKFISPKVSRVTYVVVDGDNNVTRKSRKVEFTDYVSPRFTLSRQMQIFMGEKVDIPKVIGAIDSYDNKEKGGDITNKVKILSSTVKTNVAGEYMLTAQVTNSLGDTSLLNATVLVRPKNNLDPKITLKENIVYLKIGDDFKPMSYVEEAYIDKHDLTEYVTVESTSVDMDKEGFYSVKYAVKYKDEELQEHTGYGVLTVVVTE